MIIDHLDYTEDNIIKRYKDLAGQLGNLLNRSTAPALNPEGTIPVTPKRLDVRDETLYTKLTSLPGNKHRYNNKQNTCLILFVTCIANINLFLICMHSRHL